MQTSMSGLHNPSEHALTKEWQWQDLHLSLIMPLLVHEWSQEWKSLQMCSYFVSPLILSHSYKTCLECSEEPHQAGNAAEKARNFANLTSSWSWHQLTEYEYS